MTSSRSFPFAYRPLNAGELATAFEKALATLGVDSTAATFGVTDTLPDGTTSRRDVTIKDLENVCAPTSSVSSRTKTADGAEVGIFFLPQLEFDRYWLQVEAPSPRTLFNVRDAIESVLRLGPPAEPKRPTLEEVVSSEITSRLAPVLDRLAAIERKQTAGRRRIRCFLSYRFTEASELVALRVQQFLTHLNVDVLTGARYEPRQVTEKVLSRLREPLDFIVVLIANDGEFMWTRDEIGAAIHKGVALVPLVEKEAKIEPGLFGDIEFIEFASGHIGDAFLKLLQAVLFISEQNPPEPDGA